MKSTEQSGWCGAHSKPLACYYTAAPIRKAKTLTEADVAAAQKEPTEGKPRMEYKARLCRTLLAVLVILIL